MFDVALASENLKPSRACERERATSTRAEMLRVASYLRDLQFSHDFSSISLSPSSSPSFPVLVILPFARFDTAVPSDPAPISNLIGAQSISINNDRFPSLPSVLDAWALNAHNARSLIALNACGHGGAPVCCPKRADCKAG